MSKKYKKWTDQQEQLLITWAEKASGYSWLHQKSIRFYKVRNLLISIPSALFGYAAGAGVLLSDNDFNTRWTRALLGAAGIISGLLSNFQDMFTFKEEGEKHRIAALRFLAFFREISCELSMEPESRNSSIDYITMKRLEFDKILEQAPDIPSKMIKKFNMRFKNLSVHKPDVVAGIQTIMPYGKKAKVIMYIKNLTVKDKIILLKFFSAWKKLSVSKTRIRDIEITNSNQSDLVTIVRDGSQSILTERERNYINCFGPLSRQKNMFEYQNIKFKRDPLSIDLENEDNSFFDV